MPEMEQPPSSIETALDQPTSCLLLSNDTVFRTSDVTMFRIDLSSHSVHDGQVHAVGNVSLFGRDHGHAAGHMSVKAIFPWPSDCDKHSILSLTNQHLIKKMLGLLHWDNPVNQG